MAAKKQTAAKKPAATKKTTSSKGKATAQRNNTKSRSAYSKRPSAPEKEISPEAKRQRTALILLGIAAIMLAATLIKGERVWLGIHNTIFGLFGICSFAWPLMLIYLAVVIAADKSMVSAKSNIIGVSVFVILLSGIVHIFSGALDFGGLKAQIDYIWSIRDVVTVKSGGVIGAIIGGLPYIWFGKTAAAIVLIVLTVIVLMFVTGTTLLGIYIRIKDSINKIDEKKVQRREDRELYHQDEAETYVPKKKKKFVPIDIGPDATPPKGDDIFIEELVGNAEKKEVKPNKKEPKPFVDVNTGEVIEDKPAALDEIIKRVNGENKKVVKPEEKPQPKKEEKSEPVAQLFPMYKKPPLDCLRLADNKGAMNYEEELKINAKKLIDTLDSFGVSTKIVDICRGPSVTRYELQPAAGVKISKITGLSDDIALALASSGVRIEAPIPNKAAVGIEVPNRNRATVSLKEIIDTPVYKNAKSKLNVALGKDITGNVICADVAKMPHLLIAGTTGSGKSVCLNSMIVSILYNANPDEVKLVMIDPKQVEFTIYNGIPHLLVPVVSDPRKAAGALGWAVTEMLQRYKMFSEKNVRDIKGYNKLAENDAEMTPMPQIVIFIDELSDLMMAAPNEVEDSICRLAQMARAAGMHLVIATQRPSVDVITGIIKANIPSRIALSVSSQVDSRTIIDTAGAEKLLGNGDMLFNPVGVSKAVRVQGCYVSDEEVESVVNYIKNQGEKKEYDEEVMQEIERQAVIEKKKGASAVSGDSDDSSSGDEMVPKAIEVVVEAQMASTTLLQRKLKLGYARAARIVDELEQRGIVGPFEGSKPRKVLISKQQWMEMNALANASAPIENPIQSDDDYE
jgi:S-DNA-T family DNA segregation ATPase FtsK/SpoIIIE